MGRGDLREEGWKVIEPLLPAERGRWGRPAGDNRKYVNGMLWVLRTGAPWRDLPEKYGNAPVMEKLEISTFIFRPTDFLALEIFQNIFRGREADPVLITGPCQVLQEERQILLFCET